MSDEIARSLIRGVVSIMILIMFWNVTINVIDLVKFSVEQGKDPSDIALIGGVPSAMVSGLLAYAFKLLMGK